MGQKDNVWAANSESLVWKSREINMLVMSYFPGYKIVSLQKASFDKDRVLPSWIRSD